MSERPKINIGLDDDDDLPPEPRIRREIPREALKSLSETHGFDRPVAKPPSVAPPAPPVPVIDGRSMRRTGRTAQMNAKVLPEVRDAYLQLAVQLGHPSIGHLLEEALDLLRAKYPQE